MNPIHFRFWPCPNCIHARGLNVGQMTNRCQQIDQGKSPVDGSAWEYQDHDICPAFESQADQEADSGTVAQ